MRFTKIIALAVGGLVAASVAYAEELPAATAAPDYAVPVEALGLGKAKGKWTESAFSAGEYVFASDTRVIDRSGMFSVDVLGSTRSKKEVQVSFRFTTKDGTPRSDGKCTITSRMWSGLWNNTENTLYTCSFADLPPDRFAFEAVVPEFAAESGSMLSITDVDPEKYKVLKARMLYDGALYEAVPTGLVPDNEFAQQRVATGYTISREGATVGRIDFPDLKGKMVFGDPDKKSIITAPVAAEDGREAVIFFAGQLLRLPEANSPALVAE